MDEPHKKGFMSNLKVLPAVAILLVVTGIIFALGLQVQSDNQDTIEEDWCDANSYYFNTTDGKCYNGTGAGSETHHVERPNNWEYNASSSAIEGTAEIPAKLPTIGVAIAAVVVIAIVASAFAFASRR